MKCNVCGFTNANQNVKYCSNCGAQISYIQNKQAIQSEIDANKSGTPFLVMGIIMAFCCSMPFGAAVILFNELKYKNLLKQGMIEEANKIKTIMIILLCIGIFSGILSFIFSFGLELLKLSV